MGVFTLKKSYAASRPCKYGLETLHTAERGVSGHWGSSGTASRRQSRWLVKGDSCGSEYLMRLEVIAGISYLFKAYSNAGTGLEMQVDATV